MPDPGLSSLPVSPPAPAARPVLPGPPSLPFGSTAGAAVPASADAPEPVEVPVPVPVGSVTEPATLSVPEQALVPEQAVVSEALTPLERILSGPSGFGTTALSLARRPEPEAAALAVTGSAPPAEPLADPPTEPAATTAVVGNPIPGLYYHPIPEPDPLRVEEVSRRIKDWAVDEVQMFPPEWADEFDGFSVGRYMVACHPDAPSIEHLMVATRLMVAENAVDDIYCEDHGGSPVGLGSRLLLAHTALDPVHTTPEYQAPWEESLASDAPRRAYHSAMKYFTQLATASQADRFRHDMARLHLGYLAEAAWAETDHVPEVWEYLAMRQFNNFRPCPTLTDSVGGYELPMDLHAQPAMQRVIALAGNATTIVNDLYSYTKELDSPGTHLNLPVVIAERENLSAKEGYLKAVEVHNDLMRAFEAEAAALAATCPVPTVLRFLKGVAVWVDGNHYWHQTNTFRYSLPDFW
ncbi:family 2 encapsulin nanocompartment cargo protein terpene cyclase [Streptomyces sp. NPDC090025]|uniref:family 2 encapsulin nanocompartment cargo protein terpene cyclase n=1 Tax=Streptomyces sp. NPDC090025 TaxID=3365922 RepID=UPI0038370868